MAPPPPGKVPAGEPAWCPFPPARRPVPPSTQHAHEQPHSASSAGGFFTRLFDTDFTPRAVCIGPQNPETIWLHVVSDSLIALAYFSIPIALLYFVRRRHDLAFHWIYVMFAGFILACGATHVLSAIAIWRPFYRLDGVVKLLTAAISMGTAAALWPLIPKALALPSPEALRRANETLQREARERLRAEEALHRAHHDLEQRIADRTRDLAAANASLQEEIAQRQKIEARQSLMMAELDHRVKNNMATVLSLAEQTAASAPTTDAFIHAFNGRISSLARLHEILARSRWGGADLQEVVSQTLRPYMDPNADPDADGGQRIHLDGESLIVPARAGTTICMALHELATNAAKYGALAAPAGRVTVRWRTETNPSNPTARQIRLTWEETGGPPVQPATRTGFGTEFIKAGIRYELRGHADLDFRPSGVVCNLVWPITANNPPTGPEANAGSSRKATGGGGGDGGVENGAEGTGAAPPPPGPRGSKDTRRP